PYPGHEVAIVDEEGRVVPPGELGVIAVRRGDPVIMLGYWNRPEATAAAYRGDWFCTGDLGVMDGEGYVHSGSTALPDLAATTPLEASAAAGA
ncbi:MAG: AMP-binding protein, partial [Gemmatimonadales bacterium]|nr:AMP-binding protein [Gemmatimonadales bacterium]